MEQSNNVTIPVVFFGSSKYVLPILEVLRKNYDLVLVLTTEKLETESVPAYCKKNSISYLAMEQFNNETMKQLKGVQAPLGILAYFGLILPAEILHIFPQGIINVHPSLLPRYRGPTPIQTAILSGDRETGVTIIKLDKEIDHGPMLAQVNEKILSSDTADSLYERLFSLGAKLLAEVLPKYLGDKIKLKPQNHTKATFTDHLSRQNGYITLNNPPPPEMLHRMIRAYHPWPGIWTKVQITTSNKKLLTTNKLEVSSKKLAVRIKFLPASPRGEPEKKIQVEGGKPMTYKDFLNGYPQLKEIIAKIVSA